MGEDKTKLWMGCGLLIAGLFIIATVLLGSFDWGTLVLGAIPTAIGAWLILK